MTIQIYHNPRCSKSRQTLGLLEERGFTPEIILYLENPPSKKALERTLQKLGIKARELIRFKDDLAKQLAITAKDDRSENEWLELLVNNPALIERPVVINGNKAAIGRPPENVLDIL
ncbi:MAG: arsenate reductase (glutaredoxin) [Pseudomonadales bacterium]|nr:arsenate reductase (glutaredoxin) [Pseudomonadales bacterium]